MLSTGSLNGHRAVWLENDLLRIAVLPEKGADVCEFVHKPSGVELLLRTPEGLRPPRERPQADFLENYEGGWQELFPSVDNACEYRGKTVPFHGEVALLPWSWGADVDGAHETAARFSVRCRETPFEIVRRLRLPAGEPVLLVEEAVTNLSAEPAHLVWGQHIVLGGGFLEAGCRLEVPAATIITPDEPFEPATIRLAPGQCEPWPLALGRRPGERIDLRQIPGPEAHSHDDALLTGLAQGLVRVSNPRLGLTFSLQWDAALYRYVCLWQPLGGAEMPPLTGTYGLGVEPWVSRYNLAGAIGHGEAVELGPGQTLRTVLQAAVLSSCSA